MVDAGTYLVLAITSFLRIIIQNLLDVQEDVATPILVKRSRQNTHFTVI